MAITARDDSCDRDYTAGTVAATINVQETDLIVVSVGNPIATVWCTGVTDTIGNSYTVRTGVINDCSLVFAYCLSSIGSNAGNVITASFNNADEDGKSIIVSSWAIDSGDVVTLDGSANKTGGWEASPWETASDLTTTGTDELVIACFQANATVTYTNHEIPSGTAADGVLCDPGYGIIGFYRILTETLTNEEAEVDPSAENKYSAEVLAFKSEAGGGGISMPLVMLQHDHFSGGKML